MNATKSIAANAENFGPQDKAPGEGAVKFISRFKEHTIVMLKKDAEGKTVFKTDANGNSKVAETVVYQFAKVPPHKNAEGKIDPNTAFCYLIVDPKVHGEDFNRLLAECNTLLKNPVNKLYTEEGYFKSRNPEAFRIAKEKTELENQISDKDKQIEELKAKLGFKR